MPEKLEPTYVGCYLLRRRLGTGGSGTVWEAEDEAGNLVALKRLHPIVAADESSRRRLAQEARLVNQVEGPGVSTVIDYEADDSDPFIVTEFIEGPTLAEVLSNGPLPMADAAVLAEDLQEILERVHAAEVVHRDLKPSNVIMSLKGPHLIDFGIAQEDTDERLTKTGMITGTPGYVSPELLSAAGHAPFDVRIQGDWWAWSALVLTSVTGRPPFGTGHPGALARRLFDGDPDVDGLPAAVQAQFRRALAVDPGARIAPAELVAALSEAAISAPDTVQAAPDRTVSFPNPDYPEAMFPDATWVQAPDVPESSPLPPIPGPPSIPPAPTFPAAAASAAPPESWYDQLAVPLPYVFKRYPIFPLSVLAVLAWLAILPAAFHAMGLVVAALVLLVFSWIGAGSQWVEKRRVGQGGRRAADFGLSLALFPRHILFGTLGAVPAFLVGALSGVFLWLVMTGSAGLGWETLNNWWQYGSDVTTNPVSVWIIAGATLAVSYLFPTATTVRRGLQLTIAATAPNRWVRGLIASLLLVGAVGLVALLQDGATIF